MESKEAAILHQPFSEKLEEPQRKKSGFYVVKHPIARPARRDEQSAKKPTQKKSSKSHKKKVVKKESSELSGWKNPKSGYDERLSDLDREINELS